MLSWLLVVPFLPRVRLRAEDTAETPPSALENTSLPAALAVVWPITFPPFESKIDEVPLVAARSCFPRVSSFAGDSYVTVTPPLLARVWRSRRGRRL